MRRGLVVVAVLLALASSALGAPSKPAPPIAGTTLDGQRLALRDLRGKPVLINVWSSW